ncbi:hypothetical protein [Halobacillus naozhouensis]|uniref:SdpI/YhfL protein family protein n=1 Tax=Halobacillus naozhouensis TaxID=554880 RepID=A0ABY8J1C0_9BACI|nr:hypothetical protein [Halobacillus naozhouensis]WFT75334.1 hypothetical protein P9989_02755 [Halobacillus naozhouensis]
MNVTYRTNFLLKIGIPLILFYMYFFQSHSTMTLVAAIVATIHYGAFGIDIHKKGNWTKVNLEHDQRTRSNAHFAGYITCWAIILLLFIGGVLVLHTDIPLTFPNVIAYTILASFVLRWIIRDYLNNREEIEDALPLN